MKKHRTQNINKFKEPKKEITQVVFSHPSVGQLNVPLSPDEITWSYGLNTNSYPTYGGEVVQILSMYVGDMKISGTVRSYDQIEEIYKWFTLYMQQATQGRNSASYDMTPVSFEYLNRGWKFQIMPKSLPGFKYGRDIVAPQWNIEAAVVEFNDDFKSAVMDNANLSGISPDGGFEPFGTVTAGIGYDDKNPWSQNYPEYSDLSESQNEAAVKAYQKRLHSFYVGAPGAADWQNQNISKPTGK